MSDNKTTLFTVRITPKLAENLKQIADQETNTMSAVARRLITKGVSRELKSASYGDDDQDQ